MDRLIVKAKCTFLESVLIRRSDLPVPDNGREPRQHLSLGHEVGRILAAPIYCRKQPSAIIPVQKVEGQSSN
jgi:hypothetical protein